MNIVIAFSNLQFINLYIIHALFCISINAQFYTKVLSLLIFPSSLHTTCLIHYAFRWIHYGKIIWILLLESLYLCATKFTIHNKPFLVYPFIQKHFAAVCQSVYPLIHHFWTLLKKNLINYITLCKCFQEHSILMSNHLS